MHLLLTVDVKRDYSSSSSVGETVDCSLEGHEVKSQLYQFPIAGPLS